jgi:hypothetical protein
MDMVERRRLRDFPTDGAALIDAVAALRARGAVWMRARFGARTLTLEGWRQRPRTRNPVVKIESPTPP